MVRGLKASSLSVLALIVTLASGLSAQAPSPAAPTAAAPTAATPENVASFLGDWTLSAEGPNGPGVFALSVKTDAGKVTAEISSEVQGKQPVTELLKKGTSLILKYGFDYQGNPVSVVVTLTPSADKVLVDFDFADGAYVMSGTATKKPKA